MRIGLFFVLAIASYCCQADTVISTVIDVQGLAHRKSDAGSVPVTILQSLSVDSSIELASNTVIKIVHFATRKEYIIIGPGRVDLRANGISSSAGLSVTEKPLEPVLVPAMPIDDSIVQGAFQFRGQTGEPREIRLIFPADEAVRRLPLTLRWQPPVESQGATVAIVDAKNAQRFAAKVTDNHITVEADAALESGAGYTWSVTTTDTDGKTYTAFTNFRILSEDELATLSKNRPATGASVGEQVIFAILLERLRLFSEAREYWRGIATERPGELEVALRAGNRG